jgi:hypothetical protein
MLIFIQLNECIIKKAGKVYATDLCEKAHSRYLHKRLDEKFKELSGVDTEDWSLFKLATALKIMFDPHGGLKVGFPHKVNLNFFCKSFSMHMLESCHFSRVLMYVCFRSFHAMSLQ